MALSANLRQAAFDQDGPLLAQWASEGEHDGRAYKDPETGQSYPSVTTVLRNSPKADLMGWAAMKVAERARDRPDIVMGDPDKVVARLQYAHTDYRDERGWIGSKVHKVVDADVSGLWFGPEMNAEESEMVEQWESFNAAYEVEPILSECTILGDGYMGTLDGIWKLTDRWTGVSFTTLLDLKTSKGIWREHGFQLAALSKATHRFEQVDPGTEGALVHKHPKLGKTYWLKHEGLPHFDSVKILHIRREGWQLLPVNNLEENYAAFQSYLSLWNALKALKIADGENSFG